MALCDGPQDGEATGADGQPVEVARGTGGAPGVSYAFNFYLDHLRLRQPPEGQDALRTCLQLLEVFPSFNGGRAFPPLTANPSD